MLSKHNKIVYIVSIFSAIGGFLIGYYGGVLSGILMMPSFREEMGLDSDNPEYYETVILNNRTGSIAGILLLGCCIGALIGGQVSDRFSRKYSIAVFSFLLTIGSAIQTFLPYFEAMLTGRFISGLSIGALSMIIPVYQSEIAATKVRGRVIAMQHCAVAFGMTVSSWINVEMHTAYSIDSKEWQIPVGLQMIPSLILSVGILFCPFSPRWLVSCDRVDEAQQILMNIRSSCYDDIKDELDRIKDEVAYLRENEIESYRQLFRPPLRRLFLSGICIQVFQQLTGINGTISYSPQVFRRIFVNATQLLNDTNLFLPLTLSAGYASVFFVTALATIFFINHFKRRTLLVIGGVTMCIALISIGFLMIFGGKPIHVMPNNSWVYAYDINDPYLRVLLIVCMHIYVVGFAFSWGPIPWAYCAEIFPITIRAKATSLTTAANWLTSAVVTYVVPLLLVYLPFGIYLIFSFLCGLMTIIAYVFYSDKTSADLETRKTIEDSRRELVY